MAPRSCQNYATSVSIVSDSDWPTKPGGRSGQRIPALGPPHPGRHLLPRHARGSSNQSMLVIVAWEQAWRRSGRSASMSPVQLLSWKITLVCGASGVGKSRLAVSLARGYGHPLAEADDVVTAVKALTTPESAPIMHLWDSHPEAAAWPPAKIAEHHFTVAEALRPGLLAIIADHLAFNAPVVLEGDYVLPDLAVGFGSAVRAVVVSEDDPDQLVANFAAREPGPAQHGRAAVSILVGAELVHRAEAAGQVVVSARPWHDLVERADRVLRGIGHRDGFHRSLSDTYLMACGGQP